jgi:hypothetical protein
LEIADFFSTSSLLVMLVAMAKGELWAWQPLVISLLIMFDESLWLHIRAGGHLNIRRCRFEYA